MAGNELLALNLFRRIFESDKQNTKKTRNILIDTRFCKLQFIILSFPFRRDHKVQQIRRSNPDDENTHSGE